MPRAPTSNLTTNRTIPHNKDCSRKSSGQFHWDLRSFAKASARSIDYRPDHVDSNDDEEAKETADFLDKISERSHESTSTDMFHESTIGRGGRAGAFLEQKQKKSRPSTIAMDIFCNEEDIAKRKPTRVGTVDGREIKFELREGVSKPAETDRETRLFKKYVSINYPPATFEARARVWFTKRGLVWLSTIYLGFFLILNVAFAGFFYIEADRCCDDPDLTFSNVFAFTVQTSTTIGYGGYVPQGYYSNFLVVMLSYYSTLLNTIFAGLIFARFIRPEANIVFSNVMTYCNFNGLPCLSIRVGNVDGFKNKLINAEARLTYVYVLDYEDENGNAQKFGQTEELRLLNDKQQWMRGVWTLRHVLDEKSPLFGLDLNEYPGSSIMEFRVSITATQHSTQGLISEQTGYMKEDVMIGHAFDDQVDWDADSGVVVTDYSKMSGIHPQPVWYPASGQYGMT